MGLSSMTRMYTYFGSKWEHSEGDEGKEILHRSLSRSETCFWVGDLYEAWALYQFGLLTLDVIKANIEAGEQKGELEERAAARSLRGHIKAVESLVWLGVIGFVLVCVA